MMIKNLKLTSIALSTLLLIGCGGGGSSDNGESQITTQLKQSDAILIIHGMKESACSLTADATSREGVKGVIYDSPSNTVSCSTYGKIRSSIDDNNAECAETTLADFSNSQDISLLESTEKACVIGGKN